MSAGFFVEQDSALHRLHPVTKVVALALAFASALVIEHPLGLLLLGLVYGLFGVRAGVGSGVKRVWAILLLVAFASFAIWSLAYGGETVVVALGPLTVTVEGMIYGAGMGMRLDLMAFCGLIFLAATRIEDFNYGLVKMGLPYPVSFAMSLSFRLVPLFSETVRTIQDAQRARGLDPGAGGIAARVKSYVPLLAPVFAGALRRTDQLAVALESKGFGRGGKRGSLREHEVGVGDAVAILFMMVVIGLEIVARVLGYGAAA